MAQKYFLLSPMNTKENSTSWNGIKCFCLALINGAAIPQSAQREAAKAAAKATVIWSLLLVGTLFGMMRCKIT